MHDRAWRAFHILLSFQEKCFVVQRDHCRRYIDMCMPYTQGSPFIPFVGARHSVLWFTFISTPNSFTALDLEGAPFFHELCSVPDKYFRCDSFEIPLLVFVAGKKLL